MNGETKYPPPGRVFWCWDIHFACNYKCPYCWLSKEGAWHPSGKCPYLGAKKLAKIWNGIYEKYGKCHIHISGGEPSSYPEFFEFVAQVSQIHAVEFDTNLSFDPSLLIKKAKSDRVKIDSSFHPDFVDFDAFFSKVLRLRDSGFKIGTSYVGYPPFLENLKEYRKICDKNNIDFGIQAFRGNFNGKEYPSAYTDQENMLIGACAQDVTRKILKHHSVDGRRKERRLCRMGQMGAKIFPNGDVFRCCTPPEDKNKVGNIYDDEDFRLFDEPKYCDMVPCPCWRAMIVGKEKEWQRYWYIMQ